jgi:hypothetical protein
MSASNSQSPDARETSSGPVNEQTYLHGGIFSLGVGGEDKDPESDDDEDAEYVPAVEDYDEFEGAHCQIGASANGHIKLSSTFRGLPLTISSQMQQTVEGRVKMTMNMKRRKKMRTMRTMRTMMTMAIWGSCQKSSKIQKPFEGSQLKNPKTIL